MDESANENRVSDDEDANRRNKEAMPISLADLHRRWFEDSCCRFEIDPKAKNASQLLYAAEERAWADAQLLAFTTDCIRRGIKPEEPGADQKLVAAVAQEWLEAWCKVMGIQPKAPGAQQAYDEYFRLVDDIGRIRVGDFGREPIEQGWCLAKNDDYPATVAQELERARASIVSQVADLADTVAFLKSEGSVIGIIPDTFYVAIIEDGVAYALYNDANTLLALKKQL
jgi:hypothetical protein